MFITSFEFFNTTYATIIQRFARVAASSDLHPYKSFYEHFPTIWTLKHKNLFRRRWVQLTIAKAMIVLLSRLPKQGCWNNLYDAVNCWSHDINHKHYVKTKLTMTQRHQHLTPYPISFGKSWMPPCPLALDQSIPVALYMLPNMRSDVDPTSSLQSSQQIHRQPQRSAFHITRNKL